MMHERVRRERRERVFYVVYRVEVSLAEVSEVMSEGEVRVVHAVQVVPKSPKVNHCGTFLNS